jgi:hypothetical protein
VNTHMLGTQRKPIHDAADNAPECMRPIGVTAGQWFFGIKAQCETLLLATKEDVGGEARRLAELLKLDALDYCLKKQDQWRPTIEPPAKDALLCMFKEQKDSKGRTRWTSTKEQGDWDEKQWRDTGRFLPTTLTIAARRLDLPGNWGRQGVDGSAQELEAIGLLSRTGEVKGQTRLWLHARPVARKRKIVNVGVYNYDSTPNYLAQRIIDLNRLSRKSIFSAVSHSSFPFDAELLSDHEYEETVRHRIETFAEEASAEFGRLKAIADRDLAETNRQFNERKKGVVNASVYKNGNGIANAGVSQNAEIVNAAAPPYIRNKDLSSNDGDGRLVGRSLQRSAGETNGTKPTDQPTSSVQMDEAPTPDPGEVEATREYLRKFIHVIHREATEAEVMAVTKARAGKVSIAQLQARVDFRITGGLPIRGYGIFVKMADELIHSADEWNRARPERSPQEIINDARRAEDERNARERTEDDWELRKRAQTLENLRKTLGDDSRSPEEKKFYYKQYRKQFPEIIAEFGNRFEANAQAAQQ